MAVLSIPEASIKVLGLYDNSGTLFGWSWVKKQTDINNQMSQNDDKSMDGIVRISYRPLWVVLSQKSCQRKTYARKVESVLLFLQKFSKSEKNLLQMCF